MFANGSMRKVPRCNVKLHISRQEEEVTPGGTKLQVKSSEEAQRKEREVTPGDISQVKSSVHFDVEEEADFGENIEEEDVRQLEGMRTRSMNRARRNELERDNISTFWLQLENSECYDDVAIYAVEVPVKEHKNIEVIEARNKELENLFNYDVFEEVDDLGQDTIGSRWVITKKEKADGQKTVFKGRLVARAFRRNNLPNLIHQQC